MIIAAKYAFNGGDQFIKEHYSNLLAEVEGVISRIDASVCKTKESKEKTMTGRMLYSPVKLNESFKVEFAKLAWANQKVAAIYSEKYYMDDYTQRKTTKGAFRDMDFVKEKLGVEVQFGKYSFMVYNVCAKMTIFKNLGIINAGIEIVPIKQFAEEMSTGVSYFEQFVWDLEMRGVSNIDIPVFIFGIDA